MAVNKELYERYKKLKAEGVNITLAELKQQMENELLYNNSQPEPPENVKTELEHQAQQYIQHFVNNNAPSTQPQTVNSIPSYTTEAHTAQIPQPAQQSLFNNESANQNNPQPQQIAQSYSNISQPQNEHSIENPKTEVSATWTTTYSQPQIDKNSEIYKNYSNSFNAYFSQADNPTGLAARSIESYSQSSNQPSYNTTQTKYTGNISEEALKTANSENKILNKYCLIGYPLGHSLSTYIHQAGFKSLGIDAAYDVLETPPDTLVERIKYLKNNGFAGFNVTIPLKLPITIFLDKIDTSADIVGAVNTVVINQDKTLTGYNTDVIGFRNAIPNDIILAGKTAGVLGTGGAARAAITALAQNQVKQIKLYTRNIPNSLELLNFLRTKFPNIEFNAFQIERIRDLSDVQILVNTTPIGMQGRAADMTPVEENELRTLPAGAVVYDVIYNPKKTVLLKLAQKNGYRTINGVDMFIHQAVAAQQIWTGRTPDFKDMKIAALENL